MRELRADQYGLRTALLVAGQPIKFEIILEGRVSLNAPDTARHGHQQTVGQFRPLDGRRCFQPRPD